MRLGVKMSLGLRSVASVLCAGMLTVSLGLIAAPPSSLTVAKRLLPRPGQLDRYVQVAAHPDDDLLFMSPDLFGPLAHGGSSVTIVLTSGESKAGLDDRHDPHVYAAERESGLKAAYAWLAGVRDVWRSSEIDAAGVPVRLEELAARPSVRLVFVGLHDGGDPRADGGRFALSRIEAAGPCVRRFAPGLDGCLDRSRLIAMLGSLYARFRPTVLRTLDPYPPVRPADHFDHTSSARLAAAAVAAARLRLRVLTYRGYSTTNLPANVMGAM